MEEQKVVIDKNQCIGCGLCVKACVAHNIELNDKKAQTIFDNCIMCGHCSAICPKTAITISGCEGQTEKTTDTKLNPDDVLNVIRFRRSIRKFKDAPIDNSIIEQILEAGRLSHTAKNMQDVSFVVLDKEKNAIEQMAISLFKKLKPFANMFSRMTRHNKITDNFFFFDAPIVIVIAAKDKTNGLLAAQNMEFVAEANGLGVLYSGFFAQAANASGKIKKALTLEKGKSVTVALVLGYPDIKYLRSAPRKPLNVKYM